MNWHVDPKKITDYLLNPNHPKGGPKSAFFLAMGYSISDVQSFVDSLIEHAQTATHSGTVANPPYGTLHSYRCNIRTPNGRNPCIISAWESRQGDWWFETAYPATP
jgi:hypothetical protein